MISSPKVSMLRLQATPKCNLNCTYCYIPPSVRRQRGSMSAEVLETTITRLLDEDLLEDELAISWHGAEPLAAGLPWYRDAFDRIGRILGDRVQVSHVFQSNGVAINDEWCDFFLEHRAQVGISIDGDFEQNAARVTWTGLPAFELTMRGAKHLNRRGIKWTLLSVAGHETMRNPHKFIHFVRESGCAYLGFKVEETNVANESELQGHEEIDDLYARFVTTLWEAFPRGGPLRVREFDDYRRARQSSRRRVVPVTLIPFRNLTVAANGDFTIFAGELLFRDDDQFVFGNVLDGPLLDALVTERFRALSREIRAGVQRCADNCPFYSVCGSFYISQKHAEAGTFDAEETLACRLEIKTMFRALDECTHAAPAAPA